MLRVKTHESTKKLLKPVRKFSNAAYKIHIQKSIIFLYTKYTLCRLLYTKNGQSENEIRKTIYNSIKRNKTGMYLREV